MRISFVLRRLGVSLVPFLLGGPAFAQAAGSESHAAIAQGLAGSGGEAAAPLGTHGASTLGQPLTGPTAASASYRLQASVAWVAPELVSDAPAVFGTRDGAGPAGGGQQVDVFGVNFAAPGAGPLDIAFGTSAPIGAAVQSNLHAIATAPQGVGPLQNPLAAVAVAGTNLLGAHSAGAAYTYTPAMVLESPASVGGRLEMRLQVAPGDVYFLAMGKNVPGFGLPIPPWDGSLELVLNTQILQSLVPAPFGASLFQLDVPDDPNLAGGTIRFQAFAVHDFPTADGGFSNRLDVLFHP